MSRYSSNHYIIGVPLTHEQASKIREDDFYGVEPPDDDNDVFLFTHNNNFHREVCTEYDEDDGVPHFIGVEIESKGSDVPTLDNVRSQLRNFDEYAQPLLDKYNIETKPTIHLITQVV